MHQIAPFEEKTFGRHYATRFAFGVVDPALKRGATFVCRYRGKIKSVIGKALGWKRRSCRDCRYCGKSGSGRWKGPVALLINEIQ